MSNIFQTYKKLLNKYAQKACSESDISNFLMLLNIIKEPLSIAISGSAQRHGVSGKLNVWLDVSNDTPTIVVVDEKDQRFIEDFEMEPSVLEKLNELISHLEMELENPNDKYNVVASTPLQKAWLLFKLREKIDACQDIIKFWFSIQVEKGFPVA